MTTSPTAPATGLARLDARPAVRRRLRRRLPRWSRSPASRSPAFTDFAGEPPPHAADLRGQPAAQHHPPGPGVGWLAAAPRHRTAGWPTSSLGVVLGPGHGPRLRRRHGHARHVRSRRPRQLPAPGHRDPGAVLRVGRRRRRGHRRARPADRPAGVAAATPAAVGNTGGTRGRDTRRGVHRPETTRHASAETGRRHGERERRPGSGTVVRLPPTPSGGCRGTPATPPGSSTSAALVLLMTPGLALFYGGMVRAKSVLNMMMMSFGALALISVLWVLYGYSMAFGNDVGGGLRRQPVRVLRPQGPDRHRGRRQGLRGHAWSSRSRRWPSSPSRRSSRSSPSR